MERDRNGDWMVAFAMGTVLGAVAALLLAPARGEETRHQIGSFAKDMAEKTRNGATAAGRAIEGQSKRLQHAFEEGKAAYRRESSTT